MKILIKDKYKIYPLDVYNWTYDEYKKLVNPRTKEEHYDWNTSKLYFSTINNVIGYIYNKEIMENETVTEDIKEIKEILDKHFQEIRSFKFEEMPF